MENVEGDDLYKIEERFEDVWFAINKSTSQTRVEIQDIASSVADRTDELNELWDSIRNIHDRIDDITANVAGRREGELENIHRQFASLSTKIVDMGRALRVSSENLEARIRDVGSNQRVEEELENLGHLVDDEGSANSEGSKQDQESPSESRGDEDGNGGEIIGWLADRRGELTPIYRGFLD